MMALLNKIESNDPDAQIFFVGDFIDRGPDVDKVLDWCLENITIDEKYRAVRGNHEHMVIRWYDDFKNWWENGGFESGKRMPETYYDFSQWMDSMGKLSPEGLQPYIDFFLHLPYNRKISIETVYGYTIDYRIVHAFYGYRAGAPEYEQHHVNLYDRQYGNYYSKEVVVHGHTPTMALEIIGPETYNIRPGLISYHYNDINVDCGCVFKERYPQFPVMLGAICLETLEEIYPMTVEECFRESGTADAQERYEAYQKKYLAEDSRVRRLLMRTLP